MARRRFSSAADTAPALPGLAVHAAGARAAELLKERARLLREVQKKQRQVEQVKERASRVAHDSFVRMAPLVERQRALEAELVALFEELLAPGRLSVRARSQLGRLRRSLELQGLLSPSSDFEGEGEGGGEGEGERGKGGAGERGKGSERGSRSAQARPDVAGARQVGQERRSLRDIFRNLARAIHPDQARQEDERARRTEVMKQVTRAYEDGDLARLIELEAAWQSERSLAEGGDPEMRCRELERLNRELLDQLRDVTRELRDAKRDLRDAALSHPSQELFELASFELDELEAIRDAVRRFRDGKLSLSDLMRGPLPSPRRRSRARR
ncbi:MAG TPA: hypothetical protein VIW29_19825 [Polyangiaceae bacterium]